MVDCGFDHYFAQTQNDVTQNKIRDRLAWASFCKVAGSGHVSSIFI